MSESYGERVRRLNIFVERRKRIMQEWTKEHPEGITRENLQDAQAFMKRREREIKREEKKS